MANSDIFRHFINFTLGQWGAWEQRPQWESRVLNWGSEGVEQQINQTRNWKKARLHMTLLDLGRNVARSARATRHNRGTSFWEKKKNQPQLRSIGPIYRSNPGPDRRPNSSKWWTEDRTEEDRPGGVRAGPRSGPVSDRKLHRPTLTGFQATHWIQTIWSRQLIPISLAIPHPSWIWYIGGNMNPTFLGHLHCLCFFLFFLYKERHKRSL